MKEKRQASLKIPVKTTENSKGKDAIVYKYRIYPTKEQEDIIAQHIDASQAVYNYLLHQFKMDIAQLSVNKAKELGLEKIFEYDENDELVKKDYSKEILSELCKRHDIEVIYKSYNKKDKNTGEITKVQVLDYKKTKKNFIEKFCLINDIKATSKSNSAVLIKELKNKGHDYFFSWPSLRSYTDIFNSTETSLEHFRSVDSSCLCGGAQDLKRALENFYSGRSGFPTSKKRSTSARDFEGNIKTNRIRGAYLVDKKEGFHFYDIVNKNGINDKYVDLSVSQRVGIVKMRLHRPFPDGCVISRNARLIKETDSTYYICFTVYASKAEPTTPSKNIKRVGLDASLSDSSIFITSNGEKIGHTAYSKEIERLEYQKEKKLQALALKDVSSNNYAKLQSEILKLTAKITRKRRYEQQKLAQQIVKEYDEIYVEDLDLAEMRKKPTLMADTENISGNNKREMKSYNSADMRDGSFQKKLQYSATLRRKIQDVALGELFNNIELEAEKHGKTFAKIRRYYPSTQTCSKCGSVNKEYKGIENTSKRVFICDSCGFTLDRDVNAAINILNEGIKEKTLSKTG